MKYTITHLLTFAGAAALLLNCAAIAGTPKRLSAPVVITPPAVHDGSNWSRAPFPAARPQNDVTPPNGQAFDQNLPPNTPSTTPDPLPPPAPVVAIMQPRVAPGEMPTGLPGSGAALTLDPTHVEPSIRASTFEARDNLVDGIRLRVRQSEEKIAEFRSSEAQMSDSGRSQFKSLNSEAKGRRKALEKSLRAAVNASSSDWQSAREQLAADYDAYASALAQMDAAVGVPTVRR